MYVYLEPMGGFNDMSGAIYWAINYCNSTKRILLLNTMSSHYKFNFSDFFYFKNLNIICDFNEIKKIFENKNLTIYPNELSSSINNIINNNEYANYFDWTKNGWIHKDTKILMNGPTTFPCNKDVIIIIKNQGGPYGVEMFKHLYFKPNIIDYCVNIQSKLQRPYLGIHIRNTDLKSDYHKLYNDHNQHFNKFKCIYIATDDKNVITYFKSKNPNIFNFITFPDKNYYNLHGNYNN